VIGWVESEFSNLNSQFTNQGSFLLSDSFNKIMFHL